MRADKFLYVIYVLQYVNGHAVVHCNFPFNDCYYILCVKVSFQYDVKRLVLIGTCMISGFDTKGSPGVRDS